MSKFDRLVGNPIPQEEVSRVDARPSMGELIKLTLDMSPYTNIFCMLTGPDVIHVTEFPIVGVGIRIWNDHAQAFGLQSGAHELSHMGLNINALRIQAMEYPRDLPIEIEHMGKVYTKYFLYKDDGAPGWYGRGRRIPKIILMLEPK